MCESILLRKTKIMYKNYNFISHLFFLFKYGFTIERPTLELKQGSKSHSVHNLYVNCIHFYQSKKNNL